MGILSVHSISRLKFKDRIIWSMFIIWLCVDSITGYCLNIGYEIPISQLFKLSILFLLIHRLISTKRIAVGISFISFYLCIYTLNLIILNEQIISSLLLLTKCLTTFLIYLYFCACKQLYDGKLFIQAANIIFTYGFIFISINIIIGLLGYGFFTYPSFNIGYKGFFYAGNELGTLIIPIFGYFLFNLSFS